MRVRDISPAWFLLPLGLVAALIVSRYVLTPDEYNLYVAGDEYGAVEILTPLMLLPGVVFGVMALRNWTKLPTTQARIWIAIVTAGAFYMAGEEVSWGQWFFLWDTPDAFLAINDQHETNLHNTSSWLDQKPRLLLELWALAAAFRAWFRAAIGATDDPATTQYWFWPTRPLAWTGLLAALAMMPERMTDWWGVYPSFPFDIRAAETQELVLGVFLTLFLASTWVRLKAIER